MIHELLTQHFEAWYAHPDNVTAPLSADSDQILYAQRLMEDRDVFKKHLENSKMSEEQIDIMFQAIQRKSSTEATTEMESTLNATPTFEEFQAQIKRVSKDSTPGPSGLTYNMLKCWSVPTQQSAYNALTQIWERKVIPAAWKWRWLVVIPKTQDPHPPPESLRPIMMVEVYRKIWLAIINHKIQSVWEKYEILHPSQHGSRQSHGTDTASLVHVYHIESILSQRGSIHRSSWDIKKAFDSVSKVFLRISWLRLGISADLVNWMVLMDELGVTIIKSPLAEQVWSKAQYNSIETDNVSQSLRKVSSQDIADRISAFTALRGTGQGDVISPNAWVAFLDIYLSTQSKKHSVQLFGEGGCMRWVNDTAYVDDIESCSDSVDEIQEKANMITLFCRATDLELSTPKLRRSLVDISEDPDWNIVQSTRVQSLSVASEVSVKVSGFTEYLGIKYDVDHLWYSVTQHLDTVNILKKEIQAILLTDATVYSKYDVLRSSVYPMLRYKARMIAHPLHSFMEYDSLLYPLLLHISRQRRGFPKRLLSLTPE
jgi:hypothetical protein